MKIMRLISLITVIIFFTSCSSKYKGNHKDFVKFSKDIKYCLEKSCKNKSKNVLYNISFIPSALAYGGGGGGGGGGSQQQDKISYSVFKLCMKEKGYSKDTNGIFELPQLSCD